MKYQIADLEIPGRLFADGTVFDSKEDIRLQLIDYHQTDSEEPELLAKMTLDDILDYGQWEVVEAA